MNEKETVNAILDLVSWRFVLRRGSDGRDKREGHDMYFDAEDIEHDAIQILRKHISDLPSG